MFAPVGNLPPSVYWRRRIFLIGGVVLLLVLLVLTVRAATGGGGSTPVAGDTSSSTGPTSAIRTSPSSRSQGGDGVEANSRSSVSPQSSASRSTSVPPAPCKTSDLAVQATVGKDAYRVGEQPVVEMQVTNIGARPCVQDLADRQVVLKVYNGESRVWGSHDCEVQPGTDERTLVSGRPVRVSITWSGRTSTEGCKGTRQRVGAGTYTLYATLAGKNGKAARFSMS